MNQGIACTPGRDAVATSVLKRLCALSERAAGVSDRLTGKLLNVMRDATPETAKTAMPKDDESYPKLFAEYRTQINLIESSLSEIEDIIFRVEI